MEPSSTTSMHKTAIDSWAIWKFMRSIDISKAISDKPTRLTAMNPISLIDQRVPNVHGMTPIMDKAAENVVPSSTYSHMVMTALRAG